jgi:hypothetical protein
MIEPEATCLRISGTASLSRGTTNGKSTAPNLASDNHDLALARLFLSEPPVFAIGLSVLRFDVTAEIRTVDLDFAAQLGLVWIVNLRAHRFAQLVQ